jgi:hypothetical protein
MYGEPGVLDHPAVAGSTYHVGTGHRARVPPGAALLPSLATNSMVSGTATINTHILLFLYSLIVCDLGILIMSMY